MLRRGSDGMARERRGRRRLDALARDVADQHAPAPVAGPEEVVEVPADLACLPERAEPDRDLEAPAPRGAPGGASPCCSVRDIDRWRISLSRSASSVHLISLISSSTLTARMPPAAVGDRCRARHQPAVIPGARDRDSAAAPTAALDPAQRLGAGELLLRDRLALLVEHLRVGAAPRPASREQDSSRAPAPGHPGGDLVCEHVPAALVDDHDPGGHAPQDRLELVARLAQLAVGRLAVDELAHLEAEDGEVGQQRRVGGARLRASGTRALRAPPSPHDGEGESALRRPARSAAGARG